ncbi:MAG: CDP-diacylglycerol--serine O-phosphatidyltransferase [Alphaproteobacteria bacterium]|nr:CDP-diacylglycerol--serine O-phosphatidyltransferase [Alphaproteobacteria bacterium]MCB9794447.1 CDP-diacylglycerol--serine O-phosphatidyltransferase [Alphaproteobacteria bacterium]
MLKHFLNPPNWFTSASIFCGFYALLLAAGTPGDPSVFYKAGLLIGFAGIFDMLDGRVARLTGGGSEFGVQLDSLADVVSFGVAPAVLVYSWGLEGLGPVGLAAAFFYAICGTFRLARFNVETGDEDADPNFSKGLTITMAGGTMAAMVMSHAAMGRTFVSNPYLALLITLALAFLMVSDVPFRVFKNNLNAKAKAGLALLLGVLAVGVSFNKAFAYPVLALLAFYVVAGPVEGLFRVGRRRRATSSGLLLEEEEED